MNQITSALFVSIGLATLACMGCVPSTTSRLTFTEVPHASVIPPVQTTMSRDGTPIRFRVWGRGEGAIVLVHGGFCDSSYWNSQVKSLAVRYTVVTLDLAGHGLSGRSRSSWTMDAFADDVEAVMRRLSSHSIFLVGHSVGGIVALTVAQRDDPRIRAVIAIDQIRDAPSHPLNDQQIAHALEPFHRDYREHISNSVLRTGFVTSEDPALARQIAAGMSGIDQAIAIKIVAEVARTDLSALLRANTVPLSIINASHSGPTQTERIRALNPHLSNVVIMDDVGHFPMLTQPERFNDVLQSVLDQPLPTEASCYYSPIEPGRNALMAHRVSVESIIEPDLPIVDAHHHLWLLSDADARLQILRARFIRDFRGARRGMEALYRDLHRGLRRPPLHV